jgi:hypothetical protein
MIILISILKTALMQQQLNLHDSPTLIFHVPFPVCYLGKVSDTEAMRWIENLYG